jgi:hypothetical protein
MRSGGNAAWAMPVSITPGATVLTVTPRFASSCASDLAAACRPALAAA